MQNALKTVVGLMSEFPHPIMYFSKIVVCSSVVVFNTRKQA